jgi:hypothetical protein
MFRSEPNVLLGGGFTKVWGNGITTTLGPVILLHAGALILLVTTEKSLVGAVVFLLAWIVLNCLCLALVRRPTVAALISLEILITLTLLSRFKFDKLWMTVDFVDVMIVDRDTTAFLLAIFPALRWWIVLAGAATLVVIVLAWRFDRLRVRLRESVAGFAASAVVLIAVSLLWPTGLNENFEDRSYVSKFARTAAEAVHELSTQGYLDVAEEPANHRRLLPAPAAVRPESFRTSSCCTMSRAPILPLHPRSRYRPAIIAILSRSMANRASFSWRASEAQAGSLNSTCSPASLFVPSVALRRQSRGSPRTTSIADCRKRS